jgi:transcriptional regulator with XRE-family HTH domain
MRNIMPAKAPLAKPKSLKLLNDIANAIKAKRLAMGVSAATAALDAGMSRVTWHRIEKAEPSITMGAYLNAMAALGLEIEPKCIAIEHQEHKIPTFIRPIDFPQLKEITWQIKPDFELTPEEANSFYERNRRYINFDELPDFEKQLMSALQTHFMHAPESSANTKKTAQRDAYLESI